MRLKSIQDPPSIVKSLICALVTFVVMSMVMVEATPDGVVHRSRSMEPQDEARSLKSIKPHLSTNITSDYTNKTRERRLGITPLKDDFIPTIASKLGTDLSQVEEEIPALQKYERFVEVTRNFHSFLKGNDLKESSSKEVIEILLRYVDGDAAVVSSLITLDKEKAKSLLNTLFREWKEQEVTLKTAFEVLRLGKNVNEFLDSELINVWETFGRGYTGKDLASPFHPMLQVLSEQFGVPDLVKALVVRHTADMNSIGGHLYKLQLRVWRYDGHQSPQQIYKDFKLQSWDSLGLSFLMDFILVRAYVHVPESSSYREQVLSWLAFMKIPIEQLMKKELDIKTLMDDWLINKELLNKGLLKKELMVKGLMDTKLRIKELVNKKVMNKELINKKELMNKELLNKSFSKKELMVKGLMDMKLMIKELINKKVMNKELLTKEESMNKDVLIEELMDKESMIQELIKKETRIEELMNERLINAELIIKELQATESINKELLDKELKVKELVIKSLTNKDLTNTELMDKELMNKGLMEKELMDKESMKKELMKKELMIQELKNEKRKNKNLLNDELMAKESMNKELMDKELMIEQLINKDLMKKELMNTEMMNKELVNEELVNEELINKKLMNKEPLNTEMMDKEMMNEELRIREMVKWQMLLKGTERSDKALNARREMLR